MGEANSDRLFNSLNFDHYKFVPAIGKSGGNLVLWKNSVDLEVLRADKNVIHCRIHHIIEKDWESLCVYGPPQHHLRNKFWYDFSHYTA